MRKILAVIAASAAVFVMSGCGGSEPHKTKAAAVYVDPATNQGYTRVYDSTSDDWIIYYILFVQNSTTPANNSTWARSPYTSIPASALASGTPRGYVSLEKGEPSEEVVEQAPENAEVETAETTNEEAQNIESEVSDSGGDSGDSGDSGYSGGDSGDSGSVDSGDSGGSFDSGGDSGGGSFE